MIRDITDTEFIRIMTFVRKHYGINLEKKRELVLSRLAFEVERQGYTNFTQYLDAVIAAPNGLLCQRMIDKLSTNHTFFFREPDCMKHMVSKVVPELIARGTGKINIWCAAASSGQECYSVAMNLNDFFLKTGYKVNYSILGTDINQEVLDQAKSGVYDARELEKIPLAFQRRYLKNITANNFSVTPELQENISWKKMNLMDNFIFSQPFDIIFCRNVMIYYQPETRLELIKKLRNTLRKGGYLYLGTTETISLISNGLYQYVAPSIYRREDVLA